MCGALRLHFVFRLLQRGIKKRPSGCEAVALTDIVCSLQRELRAWGRVLQQTGVLRTSRVGQQSGYGGGQRALFSLSKRTEVNRFKVNLRCHTPVGSCADANLVSKIPAPSIKANRMPPMAAEPTMATGPSEEERADLTAEIEGWVTLDFRERTSLREVRLAVPLTSRSEDGARHGSARDRVPGIFLASHFYQTTVNHGEQPSPYCKTSCNTHTHTEQT